MWTGILLGDLFDLSIPVLGVARGPAWICLSRGDLFGFSFRSWGLDDDLRGYESLGVICLAFLFQSWGLNNNPRGHVFSWVICLTFLPVLGVEQLPAWI